jgi:pyridoxamine 5'-phosphate oxidase
MDSVTPRAEPPSNVPRRTAADPIRRFRRWFEAALADGLPDADAMVLATVGRGARPSARVVLLKALDERGFVFFTNYRSRKAGEIESGSPVALVFFWQPQGRQVRIEGIAARIGDDESDGYFRMRPRDSQLGAWASPQSRTIASRAELMARVAAARRRFKGRPVPRPPHWGGYRVVPASIEFWQSRGGRLHDRFLYVRARGGAWRVRRLAP